MRKLRVAFLPHFGRSITRYTRASRARVIYDLVGELTKRGHKTFLIGTEDSRTAATNIPVAPTGIFKMGQVENEFYRHVSYLVRALKLLEARQKEFDLIHNHMYPEFLPLILGSQLKIPMVTTVHTEMNDYSVDALKAFPGSNLVALSERHKQDADGLLIKYVVHNGINLETFRFHDKPGDYFLFVGRIKIVGQPNGEIYDPKGLLTAIEVAKRAKVKLLISGSIEQPSMYDEFIKPHLTETIKFIGEVSKDAPLSQEEVAALYQRARGLLFPIHWEEPFGLVVVEANACGTPVIANRRGAAPELIQNGVNGYLVDTTEEMVEAVKKVDRLDRKNCRLAVEPKYSKETMAENYERVYYDVLNKK